MHKSDRFTKLMFDPNGFDAVSKHVTEGRDITKHMIEFWKTFVSIERSYAGSLAKLVDSADALFQAPGFFRFFTSDLKETGGLAKAWEIMRASVKAIASRHEQIAEGVAQQVQAPLMSFINNTEKETKDLLHHAKEKMGNLRAARENLRKSRANYLKVASKADKMESELRQNSSWNLEKRGKFEEQLTQVKGEMGVLFAQYQVACEEVRKLQQSFFREDMPVVLNGLQNLEEERVEAAVTSLVQYSAVQHTAIPTTRESCMNLVTYAQAINKKDDIRAFVTSHLERSRSNKKKKGDKPSASIAANVDAEPVFHPPRLPKFKPFGSDVPSDEEDSFLVRQLLEESQDDAASSTQIDLQQQQPYPDIAAASAAAAAVLGGGAAVAPQPAPASDFTMQHATRSPARASTATATTATTTASRAYAAAAPVSTDWASGVSTSNTQAPIATDWASGPTQSKQSAVSTDWASGPTSPKQAPVSTDWASGPTSSKQAAISTDWAAGPAPAAAAAAATWNAAPVEEAWHDNGAASNGEWAQAAPAPQHNVEYAAPASAAAPIGLEPPAPPSEAELLDSLRGIVEQNDYYGLFGVAPDADLDTIVRQRRQLNLQYHPDQLTGADPNYVAQAAQTLALVNEVYTTIFQSEPTRDLYNRLCIYRREYANLLRVDDGRLRFAATNLLLLLEGLKTAHVPHLLQYEVEFVLRMILQLRGISPDTA